METAPRRSAVAGLLRAVLILAMGVLLLWVSLGVTLTITFGKRMPDLALQWWPWGAVPKATIAGKLVTGQNPTSADLQRAEQLARDALMREPVSVDAVRNLALAAARREKIAEADRLFAYSERLSRRDLTTQLWMIEKSVRENDIPRALQHYDRALRTSRQAPDILLATLVSASDDPGVSKPLGDLLARRPAWWNQFLSLAIRDVKDSRFLSRVGSRIRLNLADPAEALLSRHILERMVRDGHYADALEFYRQLNGLPRSNAELLRDGGFGQDRKLPPFDWWLRDEADLSASKEVFGAADVRLVLRASGGRGGEVARQLLTLPAGTFEISGRAGETGSGRLVQPIIGIRCLNKPELIRFALPPSTEAAVSFKQTFAIPAQSCGAQTISIRAAPATETEAWVDDIQIRRVAAR